MRRCHTHAGRLRRLKRMQFGERDRERVQRYGGVDDDEQEDAGEWSRGELGVLATTQTTERGDTRERN